MKRGSLLSILITLLVFSSCSSGEEKQVEGENPENLKPMHPFVLKDLDGNEVSSDDYRGKVILLNFWATWCGPCIGEIPELNEIHERYEGMDFVLLAIASQSGDADAVSRYVDRLSIQYPVVIGDNEVLQKYGIFAFPTDFIVDKNGFIREHILGAPPGKNQRLMKILDGLLEE